MYSSTNKANTSSSILDYWQEFANKSFCHDLPRDRFVIFPNPLFSWGPWLEFARVGTGAMSLPRPPKGHRLPHRVASSLLMSNVPTLLGQKSAWITNYQKHTKYHCWSGKTQHHRRWWSPDACETNRHLHHFRRRTSSFTIEQVPAQLVVPSVMAHHYHNHEQLNTGQWIASLQGNRNSISFLQSSAKTLGIFPMFWVLSKPRKASHTLLKCWMIMSGIGSI